MKLKQKNVIGDCLNSTYNGCKGGGGGGVIVLGIEKKKKRECGIPNKYSCGRGGHGMGV